MRKMSLIVLAVAVTLIVTACSSGSSSSSPASSGTDSSASSSSGGGSSDLTGKSWQLTAITEKVPAFQGVVPDADQANYTIEFKSDGTFQAKADCNQVSGTYTTTSPGAMAITLGPATLVACPEGSLGSQYVAGLGNAASYAIASGQLTITLKDEGTLVFK
jgi:heat shock protein HslJ